MDNPTLYSKVNIVQTKDTESLLADSIHLIKWNQNGGDIILDIGCGTGNVTCDILLPMLPESIKEILATDINAKMISEASKQYAHLSQVRFDVLDISRDIPYELQGKFDHVFSFFCLHWILDQRKAMKNIYNLLKPGGDTLFCMVCTAEQIYTTYLKMAKDPRWSKYMYDVKDILLPYQYEQNPSKILKENLENAGFKVELCEHQVKTQVFYDDQSLKGFMESINPFVKRMTENEKEDFMKYFIDQIKLKDPKKINKKVTRKYYSILIAYAYKPDIL